MNQNNNDGEGGRTSRLKAWGIWREREYNVPAFLPGGAKRALAGSDETRLVGMG